MEIVPATPKRTLLVGATTNPDRYAFLVAQEFADRGIEFIPIGIKKGVLFGEEMLDLRSKPTLEDIHTITLYLGPAHQFEWMDYLIGLKPKRIIFNPGTENPEFLKRAKEAGIEVLIACNLVMLRTGQY
jgi:predicted CoA-binding protein